MGVSVAWRGRSVTPTGPHSVPGRLPEGGACTCCLHGLRSGRHWRDSSWSAERPRRGGVAGPQNPKFEGDGEKRNRSSRPTRRAGSRVPRLSSGGLGIVGAQGSDSVRVLLGSPSWNKADGTAVRAFGRGCPSGGAGAGGVLPPHFFCRTRRTVSGRRVWRWIVHSMERSLRLGLRTRRGAIELGGIPGGARCGVSRGVIRIGRWRGC